MYRQTDRQRDTELIRSVFGYSMYSYLNSYLYNFRVITYIKSKGYRRL